MSALANSKHVTVYGAEWCEETTFVLRTLARHGIEHDYVDVERELPARRKVMTWNLGTLRLPMITVGSHESPRLACPDEIELQALLIERGLIRVGPMLI